MKYVKFSGLRAALFAALFVVSAVASQSAMANCWHDPNLTQRMLQHAQRGFPASAAQPPSVVLCANSVFGPNVGGDYNTGAHQIRIPVFQLQSGRLDSVIRHELAHSEVTLTGQDDGKHGGHGAAWMRIMQAAGEGHEAQLTAQHYGIAGPNDSSAANGCQARCGSGSYGSGNPYGSGGNPPGRQTYCRNEQVQVEIGRDMYGNRMTGTQIRTICWTQ